MKQNGLAILMMIAAVFCLSTICGHAQEEAKALKLVILPVDPKGNFEPVGAEELKDIFKRSFEAKAKNVQVVFIGKEDESLQSITDIQDLTEREAQKLSQNLKADFVVWGNMTFIQEEKPIRVAGIIYNQLSVIAGGRFSTYDVLTKTIIPESAILKDNTSRNRALNGSTAYKTFQKELVTETIEELASALYKNLRQSITSR